MTEYNLPRKAYHNGIAERVIVHSFGEEHGLPVAVVEVVSKYQKGTVKTVPASHVHFVDDWSK